MPLIDPHLPLVDLHRHLDGALRLETVLDLAAQHGIELPADDVEGLRPHVQVVEAEPDLMSFIAKFHWLTAVLVDLDACRRVAYEAVEDALHEGLDYVELRFSPWFMAEPHGLDPQGVTEAVVDGVGSAVRDTGLPANLIGILSRTYGTETATRELAAILACREHIVALDLAGDEARFPPELFREHFARARGAGLRVTVHAGEAAGPRSVWTSIRELGAERIGHGVAAAADPDLLAFLAERRIGVEANLTSNLQTSSIPSLAAHPFAAFLAAGVLATLNTDDPTISGIDLRHEMEVAAPGAGLDAAAVRRAQENAVEIAFLDDDEKRTLRERAVARDPEVAATLEASIESGAIEPDAVDSDEP